MGLPVVTVATGGLPVSAVTHGFGLPVEEAVNARGIAVTRVPSGGLPVFFITGIEELLEASFAYQSAGFSSTSASSYTLSGLTSVSAAGQERFVIISYIGQAAARHVTAVTIDGQVATLVLRGQGDTDSGSAAPSVEIWRGPGTSATTLNVAATLDGNAYSVYCALYVGTDVGAVLDSDISALDGAGAVRTDDISVDTVAGGAVLAGSLAYSGPSPTVTWIGVTEDLDGVRAFGTSDVFSTASASITGAATPLNVDVTWADVNVTGDSALGAICVSFSPASSLRSAVPDDDDDDARLAGMMFPAPRAARSIKEVAARPTMHCEIDRSFGERPPPQWAWLEIRDYKPVRKMRLMLRARWRALAHIRLMFPRRGCRIWRVYSHLGLKTHQVFCECGREFH